LIQDTENYSLLFDIIRRSYESH